MNIFNNIFASSYFGVFPLLFVLLLFGRRTCVGSKQKLLFYIWIITFYVLLVLNFFYKSSRYLLLGTILFYPLIPISFFSISRFLKKKSRYKNNRIIIGQSIILLIFVLSLFRVSSIHSNPILKRYSDTIRDLTKNDESAFLFCFTTDSDRIKYILPPSVRFDALDEELSTTEKCLTFLHDLQVKIPVEDHVFVLDRESTKDLSALSFRSMIEQVYGFFPFDEIQSSKYRNYSYHLYQYNGKSRDGIFLSENSNPFVLESNDPQSKEPDPTDHSSANHSSDLSIVFLKGSTPETTAYRSTWKSLSQESVDVPVVLLNQYNWSISLEKALESSDSISDLVAYSKTGHADPHHISLLEISELVVEKNAKELWAEDFIGEPFAHRYKYLWKDDLGNTTESERLAFDPERDDFRVSLIVEDRFSGDAATTSFHITRKDLSREGNRSTDQNILMLFDKQSLNWKLDTLKESEYPELSNIKMFFPQKLRKYEGRGALQELTDERSRWKEVFSSDTDARSLISELTGQPYDFDYQSIIISWGCGDILFNHLSYMISQYRQYPEELFSSFTQLLQKAYPDARILLLLPPSPYVGELSKLEGYCPWFFLRKARCCYTQMLLRIAKDNPRIETIYPGFLNPERDYRKNSHGFINPFSLTISGRKKIISSVLSVLTRD